jgi:hypothetical protein
MRMVPSIIMTLADMCSGVPVMALSIGGLVNATTLGGRLWARIAY